MLSLFIKLHTNDNNLCIIVAISHCAIAHIFIYYSMSATGLSANPHFEPTDLDRNETMPTIYEMPPMADVECDFMIVIVVLRKCTAI